ncbi:MAG: aminodeoxychorismate/anthranilate synthase component II [Lachnospiraceae bacterium]|nr:aminodeoxychorismate/anthranilate synthase component II [Lachnospiraceae bacterium]MDD7378493.1 aminodeoxychorismate/anthranilate synthase component II [Lachnospiraceae bacterium]MDY4616613.1 aminodeoxychorismate/anthranilate synthase component II [Lachnospiraceae bacterium]
MILLIDNYDSFSYNLVQYIGSIETDIQIIRNDAKTIEEIERMKPQAIILSPGPGYPKDAGVCIEAVKKLGERIPILGVCLGHQAICEAYGAKITHAKKLMHGKQSMIRLKEDDILFQGIPSPAPVARYHSLAADTESLPDCLEITAKTEDGEVMAVHHREYPVYGVQFHPESILTRDGMKMIENFIGFVREREV